MNKHRSRPNHSFSETINHVGFKDIWVTFSGEMPTLDLSYETLNFLKMARSAIDYNK